MSLKQGNDRWDAEADVIVVGFGGAGACAALEAKHNGASVLVLECFMPAQEGRRSGGPKDPALLWSRALVERHFAGLEVLELLEGAVRLDEGPRHQGLAEVVRAVLRRPA